MSRSARAPVSVFFVDNFDSFTFNLVDDLRSRGAQVEVWRNSVDPQWALERALALPAPRMLLLSPGPGRPEDAGCCCELVRLALGKIPIFGVCLGLQVLVHTCGGRVEPAGEVVHGKGAQVSHDGGEPFGGLAQPLMVGRYHSLVATKLGPLLQASAHVGKLVMAVRHDRAPAMAVQFHPESMLTPQGGLIMDRVLDWAAEACPAETVKAGAAEACPAETGAAAVGPGAGGPGSGH